VNLISVWKSADLRGSSFGFFVLPANGGGENKAISPDFTL
jgi:hypothetical protein